LGVEMITYKVFGLIFYVKINENATRMIDCCILMPLKTSY
jgi:hypothetical protein